MRRWVNDFSKKKRLKKAKMKSKWSRKVFCRRIAHRWLGESHQRTMGKRVRLKRRLHSGSSPWSLCWYTTNSIIKYHFFLRKKKLFKTLNSDDFYFLLTPSVSVINALADWKWSSSLRSTCTMSTVSFSMSIAARSNLEVNQREKYRASSNSSISM